MLFLCFGGKLWAQHVPSVSQHQLPAALLEFRAAVKADEDKYLNTYKTHLIFQKLAAIVQQSQEMFWGLQASLCMIKYFLNEQQTHLIGQEVTSDSDLQDKQTSQILRSEQSFNRANKGLAVLPDFRYPLDFRWHKHGTWLSTYTNTDPGTSHPPRVLHGLGPLPGHRCCEHIRVDPCRLCCHLRS